VAVMAVVAPMKVVAVEVEGIWPGQDMLLLFKHIQLP